MHVNAVTVLGVKNTRPSFLQTATHTIQSSKNVADVINNAQQVAENLTRLDIFDHVQILLDNARDSDPFAAPDSINVVYQVKEKSRLFIKTGTEIGNNEGNMVKDLFTNKSDMIDNMVLIEWIHYFTKCVWWS